MLDIDALTYYRYMEDKENWAALEEQLRVYADLLEAGFITQEEFDEKKRQLLEP